jgi:hypothetical protein
MRPHAEQDLDEGRPSRYRNADRVYSADARDFFRDLNLG